MKNFSGIKFDRICFIEALTVAVMLGIIAAIVIPLASSMRNDAEKNLKLLESELAHVRETSAEELKTARILDLQTRIKEWKEHLK